MQPNERFEDYREAVQSMIDRALDRVWVAVPAFISKDGYDHEKQVVKLTMGIKGRETTFDSAGKPSQQDKSMPQLPDVPVHFPAGGGFSLTWPLKDGDEGIVIFSSRCLDFWWQNSGEQPRGSERRHDLSDGMFIPGLKSQPKRLPNPSTDTTQLRTDDGNSFIEFASDHVKFGFSGGSVTIDSSGNIKATGEITKGDGTSNKVTLGNHTHNQDNDSHGDTEQPTLKPNPE